VNGRWVPAFAFVVSGDHARGAGDPSKNLTAIIKDRRIAPPTPAEDTRRSSNGMRHPNAWPGKVFNGSRRVGRSAP
jgi:hypothetical protein